MKLTNYIVPFLLLNFPALVGAQEILELSKDTSILMALESNRDFAISQLLLVESQREEKSNWNNFLPELSAYGELEREDYYITDSTSSLTASGYLYGNLDLDDSLLWSIRETELDYETQQISYEDARQVLIASVEKGFYYLLTSQSNVAIEKSNLDLTQKIYEQTLRDFENGFTSKLDLLQAQVNAANLVPSYRQTVVDHEESLRDFLLLLGVDLDQEVELKGDLSAEILTFDSQDLIAKYLSNRSDIQTSLKGIDSLENSKKLKRANLLSPTLGLSAKWAPSVDEPFDSISWSDGESVSDSATFTLSLSVPLDGFIRGSSDNLQIQAIEDDITQARIRLEEDILSAQVEIYNLTEQLKTSEANLELGALNIELAQESYDMSLESYNQGTIERLDMEEALQSLLEAKQSFLSTQYGYLVSQIELRYALGLESLSEASIEKGDNNEE